MAINSFPGNKGGSTILPTLVNFVPKAQRYFSFFYGSGGLETSKYFNKIDWIVSEKCEILRSKIDLPENVVYNNYNILIYAFNYTAADFIFCDPPYLMASRLNGKRYYKHEFTTTDHKNFLDKISTIKAKCLITHPKHEMYTTALVGWNFYELRYMTRGGWFDDGIYTNYDSGIVELYNYDCLGIDHTQRQQIKRQRNNIVARINSLPLHQKLAIFNELDFNHGKS